MRIEQTPQQKQGQKYEKITEQEIKYSIIYEKVFILNK